MVQLTHTVIDYTLRHTRRPDTYIQHVERSGMSPLTDDSSGDGRTSSARFADGTRLPSLRCTVSVSPAAVTRAECLRLCTLRPGSYLRSPAHVCRARPHVKASRVNLPALVPDSVSAHSLSSRVGVPPIRAGSPSFMSAHSDQGSAGDAPFLSLIAFCECEYVFRRAVHGRTSAISIVDARVDGCACGACSSREVLVWTIRRVISAFAARCMHLHLSLYQAGPVA